MGKLINKIRTPTEEVNIKRKAQEEVNHKTLKKRRSEVRHGRGRLGFVKEKGKIAESSDDSQGGIVEETKTKEEYDRRDVNRTGKDDFKIMEGEFQQQELQLSG